VVKVLPQVIEVALPGQREVPIKRWCFWYGEVMGWQDRIIVDPRVLVGKPVIRGTRISVELVVDLLASGWTQEQILASYPHLTAEDIRACLAYASELLHSEKVFPLTPA